MEDIIQVLNDLKSKLGTVQSEWGDALEKTAQSKNITVPEWNLLVQKASTLSEDIYQVFEGMQALVDGVLEYASPKMERIAEADWAEDGVPQWWIDTEISEAEFKKLYSGAGTGVTFKKSAGCGYAYDIGYRYNRVFTKKSGSGWNGQGGVEYCKHMLTPNPYLVPDPDFKDWEIERDEATGKITKMTPKNFMDSIPQKENTGHIRVPPNVSDYEILTDLNGKTVSDNQRKMWATSKGYVDAMDGKVREYVNSRIHSGTDAEGTSRWVGALNKVSAKQAFAAGYNNTISGPSAAAFGDGNILSGWASFVSGYGNNDNGKQYVLLGGRGNYAAVSAQALVGSFNEIDSGMVFGVGGGTSTSARKTLFRVRSDGRATLGAAPVSDYDCANKKFVVDSDASQLANAKRYTDEKLAALVNGAPEQLDALNELAAALGNDANFAATVTSRIAKLEGKIPDVADTGHWAYTVNRNSSGTNTPVRILISHAINGSYSSQIPLRANGIIKTATPVADNDCANKEYVDTLSEAVEAGLDEILAAQDAFVGGVA